jgi:hypothetical protein
MYFFSAILFCSSLTVLYIGLKNCAKTVGSYAHHYKICSVLKKNSNNDFLDHHFMQTDINKEIKSGGVRVLNQIKKKDY